MRIGTASVRRRAQLLALEPTLSVEPLRGNIDTRLRKRGERGLDAVMLAACGLDRLGLAGEIGLRLDPGVMLPEAGQGALALQVRAGEEELVARVDDAGTRARVEAERAASRSIGGGCLAPVAAYHDGAMLTALVAAEDGAWVERRRGPTRPRSPPSSSRSPGEPPVRIVVTRPAGQEAELVVAPRGARARRRPLPAARDRAARRRAHRRRRLRLGRRHERQRRPRAAAPGDRGDAPARRDRAGDGEALGGADLVPAVSTQEGLLAELPRPAGRVLFAAAEGARRLLAGRARRRLRRRCTARASCGRRSAPRGRSLRARVARRRRARSRAPTAPASRSSRSGPRRSRAAR